MTTIPRADRAVLCPFCGQAVDTAAGQASLTMKRSDGTFVYWKIHEQCLIDRISAEAAERL